MPRMTNKSKQGRSFAAGATVGSTAGNELPALKTVFRRREFTASGSVREKRFQYMPRVAAYSFQSSPVLGRTL